MKYANKQLLPSKAANPPQLSRTAGSFLFFAFQQVCEKMVVQLFVAGSLFLTLN